MSGEGREDGENDCAVNSVHLIDTKHILKTSIKIRQRRGKDKNRVCDIDIQKWHVAFGLQYHQHVLDLGIWSTRLQLSCLTRQGRMAYNLVCICM